MSDNYIYIIPKDPQYVPNSAAQDAAQHFFISLVPQAEQVTVEIHEIVVFIDPGANFEHVHCPRCGLEIDQDWWGEAMDTAHQSEFMDFDCSVPCCGEIVSLNDLEYHMPAGFAKFVLTAKNPNTPGFGDNDVEMLEDLLGCELRCISAHY